jgi:hypothetical protein
MTVCWLISWLPLLVALNFVRLFLEASPFPTSYTFDLLAPELCFKRSLLQTQKTEEVPSPGCSGEVPANEPTRSSSDLDSGSAGSLPAGASVLCLGCSFV